MHNATGSMKTMKLYDQVERIYNELLALGIDEEAPLSVEDLTPFDQYHYHGTEAVDYAAGKLDARDGTHLLEVGSGIGGPARHMAASTNCRITALELQPDLNETARGLTARCGLDTNISHLNGDVLDGGMVGKDFDGLMSFLVFLHIPDRTNLLKVCHGALKPSGNVFIEDITKLREPTTAQWSDLREKVLCSYLPTLDEYVAQLEAAGFVDVEAEDMSASWNAFTSERFAAFQERRPRNIEIHGEAVTDGLEDFYGTVSGLYDEGVLGGIRIWGRKP